MLCSSTRILFGRGIRRVVPPLSSSINYLINPKAKTLSLSRPYQRHHHISFFKSIPTLTPTPTPLRFSLKTDHTMASQSSPPKSVHDFTVKDARGNDVNLGNYKGKVLLIVNVASQCGLTNSNYTELSQLYEKYRAKGLEILAFPCNQFGAQEPGTNEQIVEFACTRFKAEYPIFDKVDVNGNDAAPLYKYLKSSKGGLFGDNIKWNFSKFLVDKEGNVVDRYAPTTSPLSIEKDIKKLLDA
ncbi:hypothetical protein HN51_012623 [Arachis hypogaea]|uniref:Glutathione peroxidase n=3 Tax=Arachis TaxID=3817 RepID=A0A445DTP6_ARAHY|nr:probable phospholipid hydroperoxide glutathione peroxidase [Arachis duranensis]XP_025689315.1 probable phospholipid hydroperoxide glutathione peroxidase [Arachis hypogaea]XP_057745920.1 probable phospholipid hydroperoxide glutathione peroxidase [Arachis stenosperma]QHO58132.1 putative phospholipid hydroperoxide glutathione peroxidase 6 [Arachis hypogaea]RYR66550.1 hypothetical protein Ahy_A03g012566 isoform B [Arachis hypogaea]